MTGCVITKQLSSERSEGLSLSAVLAAVASHSGAAMVSLKFPELRLNRDADALALAVIGRTVCFSQAGKNQQAAFLALALAPLR